MLSSILAKTSFRPSGLRYFSSTTTGSNRKPHLSRYFKAIGGGAILAVTSLGLSLTNEEKELKADEVKKNSNDEGGSKKRSSGERSNKKGKQKHEPEKEKGKELKGKPHSRQFSSPRFLQRLQDAEEKPGHAIDPVYMHGTPPVKRKLTPKRQIGDDKEGKSDVHRIYRYESDVSEAIDSHNHFDSTHYPVEKAVLASAPNVPPPITRKYPVRLQAELFSSVKKLNSSLETTYDFWTFNDQVPGPFIRARVGDVLEIVFTNKDENGVGHNIDFHCVVGPGGGAPATYAEEGETRTAAFKLLYPGLWVYHCAAEPVPVHIANGMYGMILVEPEEGLSPADKEFYVMQSEIYANPPTTGSREERLNMEFEYVDALNERPRFVVFNGKVGALTETPLRANQGDRVRLFFGNAGPNLFSAFHVIGCIMDRVHREGDLLGPPGRGIHTTTVGPGATSMIELDVPVPGNYTLLDHAIFRLDKGAVGFLKVVGEDPRTDIYESRQPKVNCPGCKLHN